MWNCYIENAPGHTVSETERCTCLYFANVSTAVVIKCFRQLSLMNGDFHFRVEKEELNHLDAPISFLMRRKTDLNRRMVPQFFLVLSDAKDS